MTGVRRVRARSGVIVAAAVVGGATFAACLPGSGPPLLTPEDAAAPPPTDLSRDAGAAPVDVDLGEPFAIGGVVPSHGPWTGGTRARLTGRGFSSTLRVWVGGVELAPSAIFASDPTRAAIEMPPGAPGAADVRIRDDRTAEERVLPGGFFYDAFVVEPSTGATSGGTRIALRGSGTGWTDGTSVTVGGKSCTEVTIADGTHLACTTPPGAPGSTDVTVTTPGGAPVQARDAFTFADSPDGYRGGLGGGALAGTLRVLAFDAWTGAPIAAVYAIAGAPLASAKVARTDAAGVASIVDSSLTGAATVTVAATCHQPLTFASVPVDTVTAYLSPVLDPACATGDPPSSGGRGGRSAGAIRGELVWGGIELKRGAWNVPVPAKATERRAAYVFTASGSPLAGFALPPAASAVTPDSSGDLGYAYTLLAGGGNVTLYALAGIEDRSVTPPRFTAYGMGVARGVSVQPGEVTSGVDIPMRILLDHEVTLEAKPPATSSRGPDRFVAQLATSLGQGAYAILPAGTQSAFLPLAAPVRFAFVPALTDTLAASRYVIGASAVTGAGWGAPASVVADVETTSTSGPVSVGGFLAVPALAEPAADAWSGTHVAIGESDAVDLVELVVTSGGGRVTWTIVAPGSARAFDLPDLASLAGGVGLVRGAITTTAYVARLDGLDYGRLRTGQLDTSAWNAYAIDIRTGAY